MLLNFQIAGCRAYHYSPITFCACQKDLGSATIEACTVDRTSFSWTSILVQILL